MTDKFEQYADSLEGPFTASSAVTPNDDADIAMISRGILVGVSGSVQVTMESGDVITIPTLVAGVVHPIRVKRVHATGTTATGIVSFW